jgi:hypothetical protein
VPLLMTEYKWASLTDRQREIYVRGFLETASFMLYSRSQKDNEEHAKTFSDWRFCAEKQPVSRWQTLDWTIRGELDKTAAAQFYEIGAIVCKEAVGKGDKTWRPLWLLKPAEWKSLSLRDRAIYVMAYVETVYVATRRAKDTANERKLDICLASAGKEGLISSMEATKLSGSSQCRGRCLAPWARRARTNRNLRLARRAFAGCRATPPRVGGNGPRRV